MSSREVGANSKQHRGYQKMAPSRAAVRARNAIYGPSGYALKATWKGGPDLLSVQVKIVQIYHICAPNGRVVTGNFPQGFEKAGRASRVQHINFVDLALRYNVSFLRPEYCSTGITAPSVAVIINADADGQWKASWALSELKAGLRLLGTLGVISRV